MRPIRYAAGRRTEIVYIRGLQKKKKKIITQNNIKLIVLEKCCAIKHQDLLNIGQN